MSYKHYLDTIVLEEAIRSSLWDLPNDERAETFEVDISGSVLGNEKGMKEIILSLLPTSQPQGDDSNTAKSTTNISFLARHNRISPKSMDDLLQVLLSNKSANETEGDQKATTDQEKEAEDESSQKPFRLPWMVKKLDMGWNELQPDAPGWKNFLKSLQKLIQSRDSCPSIIRFDRCGLVPGACRAIGKGIINRYTHPEEQTKSVTALSLHLCGNPDLGDSGTAAIAAAIRTVATDDTPIDETWIILDELDLSACEVGDAGAEALALALESRSGMIIRHLNLSNNKITDVGAAAIGNALLSTGASSPMLESLDLSGNKDIGDKGATVLADAIGKGLISCIKMRSCHMLADGAAAFGRAIRNLSKSKSAPTTVRIDLSGNPLGVLRGKAKKGGKYSASAIKSKASATTAAYMSMIRKGIKSGLRDYGVDIASGSAESDDEEEARSGTGEEMLNDGDLDPSKARCGIKAFSNEVLEEDEKAEDRKTNENHHHAEGLSNLKCKVALRRCFIDHSAADALAAVLVHSKDEIGIDLSLDIDLNPVLEEEMIEAIEGDETKGMLLREMSERYLDALEALRASRERAAEAARAAAARIEAEAELESQWNAPVGFDYEDDVDEWEEDEWDSDADYEEEGHYDEY